MIDYEYKTISKRNVTIAVISLVIILGGFIYLSHLQALEENYNSISSEFEDENIRQKCKEDGFPFLIDCFKNPFYKALREGNAYEGVSLYNLKDKLYRRDLVLNPAQSDQLLIKINNLEITYTFLKLEESRTVDRRSLRVGSLLLTKWKKEKIINNILKISDVISQIDKEIETSNVSEVDKKRFQLVRKRLLEMLSLLST